MYTEEERAHKIAIPTYTLAEELMNAISHGIGALLGIAGLVLCVVKAAHTGNPWKIVSVCIFGFTVFLLYIMSCLYHALKVNRAKRVFRVFDHCTIFLLIAGTYTPYTLVVLRPEHPVLAWVIFGVIWATAITGIVFNSINLKKFANSIYEDNSLDFSVNANLFSLGKRLNKGMITFGYDERVRGSLGCNDGLVKLLANGNAAFVDRKSVV